jgi:hypothetical protein
LRRRHEQLRDINIQKESTLYLMPHRYSPAVLQARRDRAAALGFLKPVHVGYRLMQVESSLLPAVAAGYRSLRLHRDHDRVAGVISHHGRLASLAAFQVGAISKDDNIEAARVHRTAGRAKHGISKFTDEADPLQRDDPWSLATFPAVAVAAPVTGLDPWRFFQVPAARVSAVQPHAASEQLAKHRIFPEALSRRIASLETEVDSLKATVLKLERFVANAAFEQPADTITEDPLVAVRLANASVAAAASERHIEPIIKQLHTQFPANACFSDVLVANAKLFSKHEAHTATASMLAANAKLFRKHEAHTATVAANVVNANTILAAAADVQRRMACLAAVNVKLFHKHELCDSKFVPFAPITKPKPSAAVVQQVKKFEPFTKPKPTAAHELQFAPVEVLTVDVKYAKCTIEVHNGFAALSVEDEEPTAAVVQQVKKFAPITMPKPIAAVVQPVKKFEPIIKPKPSAAHEQQIETEEEVCELCAKGRGSDYFFHTVDEVFHCGLCHASCSHECMPCCDWSP